MKDRIKTIITFFFSIIISFYILESLLIFFYKKNNDRFSEYLKYKNDEYVVSMHPNQFLNEKNQTVMQLSGISNKKTIYCNENGYFSKFISNEIGFNDKNRLQNNSKIDSLLIGDSFIFGACVNNKNSFASSYSNILKSANLSYGGNGPLIQFATLREYFDLYKPKKVIWFYYEGNDLIDLENELKNKILSKYIYDKSFSQNLISKQKLIDKKLLFFLNKFEKQKQNEKKNELKNKIFNFIKLHELIRLKNRYSRWLRHNHEYDDETIKKFENLILMVKNFTTLKKSELYIVYIPSKARYSSRNHENLNMFSYDKIMNIFIKYNIKNIDLNREFFLKRNDIFKYYPRRSQVHWNEQGHKEVGRYVAKRIEELSFE